MRTQHQVGLPTFAGLIAAFTIAGAPLAASGAVSVTIETANVSPPQSASTLQRREEHWFLAHLEVTLSLNGAKLILGPRSIKTLATRHAARR
jgi:hypothetical protein